MIRSTREEHRSSNGLFYRTAGKGPPVLLLHGMMATGVMFDPLTEQLQDRFQLIVPDLRGHGRSQNLPRPYDVPGLAADLGPLLAEAGATRCAVLGYSHGGAVAQQFAHDRPERVNRLLLACTYACNVATRREQIEAKVAVLLLTIMSTRSLVRLIVRPSAPGPGGPVGLDARQAAWLTDLMSVNRSWSMRDVARGMASFDSRTWLGDLKVPTLVIGGTHDTGVPRHHFDMLVAAIPEARGIIVENAGHTLLWTHTREFTDIVKSELSQPDP